MQAIIVSMPKVKKLSVQLKKTTRIVEEVVSLVLAVGATTKAVGVIGKAIKGGTALSAMQLSTGGVVLMPTVEAGAIAAAGAAAGRTAIFGGIVYSSAGSKGSYKLPKGGGGTTDIIKVNDKTVKFGHGGRHLEGTGLDIGRVNRALANDVIKANPKPGDFYKGQIIIDGVTIEYTSFGLSDGVINVGTYYTIP